MRRFRAAFVIDIGGCMRLMEAIMEAIMEQWIAFNFRVTLHDPKETDGEAARPETRAHNEVH